MQEHDSTQKCDLGPWEDTVPGSTRLQGLLPAPHSRDSVSGGRQGLPGKTCFTSFVPSGDTHASMGVGGDGGGAGGGGPEPPGTPPEIWDVAAQGRGGAWTLRPQSLHRLDRELEPSGCPGSGLQKLSLITPCSDCPALPFRSQEPSWTRLRVYARFPVQSGRV